MCLAFPAQLNTNFSAAHRQPIQNPSHPTAKWLRELLMLVPAVSRFINSTSGPDPVCLQAAGFPPGGSNARTGLGGRQAAREPCRSAPHARAPCGGAVRLREALKVRSW